MTKTRAPKTIAAKPSLLDSLLAKLPKLPPRPTQPPLHEPRRVTLLQLGVLIGIAIVTHFSIASAVVASFALFIFMLKMAIILRRGSTPPKFAMMVLTVFSLGMILFFYGGWNGQTAGISFLVLLVSLKFLESRVLRDYYVVCLILYFLAASTFLFNSSVMSILSVLAFTVAITGILFKISNPSDMAWPSALRASCTIIIKAVPLALILFFFFPRIGGDFGFLPSQDEADRLSGLNNSLVAGEMAASSFNTSLAFRAEFEGDIPQQKDLYWRSKVMPIERDFSWEVIEPLRRNRENIVRKRAAASLDSGPIKYNILHEKSLDFFVPYLDYVSGYSKGDVLDDYSVFIKAVEAGSFSYSGSSNLKPSLPPIDMGNAAAYLSQTQSSPSAKMQATLARLRQESNLRGNTQTDSPQDLINSLYLFFVNNEFSYSLTPPSLDENRPLDDFIFSTRTGYCEHFASAFTTMARWLEVPARVVVGYQGGTINQAGSYVEVRYSDAHAWSEVWFDGRWHRVDPTAAVSPERIEFGMEALTQLWDGTRMSSNASGRALANFLNPTRSQKLWRSVKDSWGNVGYQWNKWVVNYDMQAQREMLSNLGFSSRNSISTLVMLMGVGALAIMLFYFWQLVPKHIKRGEAQKAYLGFVRKFSKHRIVKHLSDSPREFAQRACQLYPQDAEEIHRITRSYEALRYGRQSNDDDSALKVFRRQVKRFKLTQSK